VYGGSPARGRPRASRAPAGGPRGSPRVGRGAPVKRRVGRHSRRVAAPACGARAGESRGVAAPRRADYRSAACGPRRRACARAVPGVAREEQRVAPAAQSVPRDAREKKLIVARPNCRTPERMSRMSRTFSTPSIAMWRGDRVSPRRGDGNARRLGENGARRRKSPSPGGESPCRGGHGGEWLGTILGRRTRGRAPLARRPNPRAATQRWAG
jgi:hypothetical protein